jgi:hypothetical protein
MMKNESRILPQPITLEPESTAEAPSGGGIPAAGEYQWVTGDSSAEGCPAGMANIIASQFSPSSTFRLPGDAFDVGILFRSAFGREDARPGIVLSNPELGLYVLDYSDEVNVSHFEVRVFEDNHMEGQMQSSAEGCTMILEFEVTRVGD